MASREDLISWSINYYKEQGGEGVPSSEASGLTVSMVQIRNIDGELLQEIDREFAEFKSGKAIGTDFVATASASTKNHPGPKASILVAFICGLGVIAFGIVQGT